MEINTQSMDALARLRETQSPSPRKENTPVESFEDVFNQAIGQSEASANGYAASGAMQSALVSQLSLEQTAPVASLEQEALMAAFDEASGVLNMWDDYARALGGGSDASLRDAWSALEGLDSGIAKLRSNPLAQSDAALGGLVNELEVMAAAERFKFNRGDYL